MKLYILASVAVLAACLSGCDTVATLENGQAQQIAVTTPAKGALCVLTNSRGRWQVLTPGTANVLRSKDDLQITCKKPGWTEGVVTNKSVRVIGSMDVNAVAVDAFTGGGHQYTAEITVPMTPVAAANPSSSAAP